MRLAAGKQQAVTIQFFSLRHRNSFTGTIPRQNVAFLAGTGVFPAAKDMNAEFNPARTHSTPAGQTCKIPFC